MIVCNKTSECKIIKPYAKCSNPFYILIFYIQNVLTKYLWNFLVLVFATFVDTLSVAFIISSYTTIKDSAILSRY